MASSSSSTGYYADGLGGVVLPFGDAVSRIAPKPLESGSLFPTGVEEGPPAADPAAPSPAVQPPPESKPWRKSWRRRWRKGSTYRSLTCLQARVLQYIEDNAEDDGGVTVGLGVLASVCSSSQEVISRSAIQRVLDTLTQKGLIRCVHPLRTPLRTPPRRIYRINFEVYQGNFERRDEPAYTPPIPHSRGSRQRRGSSKLDPLVAALRDAMQQEARATLGEAVDFGVRELEVLKGIRKLGIPDDDILARWKRFLSDKGEFGPRQKNLYSFRRAHTKYAKRGPRGGGTPGTPSLPPIPGIDTP